MFNFDTAQKLIQKLVCVLSHELWIIFNIAGYAYPLIYWAFPTAGM